MSIWYFFFISGIMGISLFILLFVFMFFDGYRFFFDWNFVRLVNIKFRLVVICSIEGDGIKVRCIGVLIVFIVFYFFKIIWRMW